jgi:CHAT domain-containing protein/tetratricopeptide (TPR) repeat protein
MTILPLLVASAAYAAAPQDVSQVQTVAQLAASGPQERLVAEVGRHPDAARKALHDLLCESVAPAQGSRSALASAERLARAYFEAWTDAFLVQQVQRFTEWSLEQRRQKLAADSLRLAGNDAYSREGIPAAIALWRRSLDRSEELGDAAGSAKSLGNIGAGFYAAGELDSARAYLATAYDQAVAVSDFRTAASAVTNLASLSYEQSDLPRAAELYSQSLDLLDRTGEHRFRSAAYHNLGLVSMAMGDLRGARSALEESIRLSRLHGYPEDEAESLSSLADVARAEGSYREVAELLDRALVLSRETGNQVAAAAALHSTGLLWISRGDYRRAQRLLEQALAKYTDLGRMADAVGVQEELARARAAAGDLRGGLVELKAASRLADSLSLGALRIADLALASADLNVAMNEYPAAFELFRQAREEYRAANDVRGQAAALEGQGYLSLARGDNAEAIDLLQRALRLRSRAGHADPRASALTWLYLAAAEEEAGDVAAARRTLGVARSELASLGDAAGEAAALAIWGDLEARAGAMRKADSLYQRGLVVLGERSVPEVAWRLHAGRAEILQGYANLEAAAAELRLAIDAIDQSAATLSLVEQRSAFRSDKTGVYDRAAQIELRLGNIAGAFETSERVRAQRTLAALSRGRFDTPKDVPAELAEREQDLRQRIGNLTLDLRLASRSHQELRERAGHTSLSPTDLHAALTGAQREYAGLLAELRTVAPGYSALVDPVPASLADISRLLEPDQALIEYLVADSTTIAFVVTPDTATALFLDIGRESLADLVEFARGVIARGERAGAGQLWRSPLQRLHEHLIRPIEDEGLLHGRGSLVIVPHGELHYLPFQALLRPEDEAFLVERYAVSYAPSASTWSRLVTRAPGQHVSEHQAGNLMLALAPRVGDLPGSRYEVEAVGRLFGDSARVLIGEEATEQAFQNAAPAFDIVHLATYGVLNKANPLFSYVELAETRGDVGLLETHEVYGLRLRARLLTLSACETALGSGSAWDVPPGDDWVSLAAAFLSAGAANVLASLWQVEDLATAELMQRFYRHVATGEPLASSLAEAQRELIANSDTAHPLYWAGFMLVGRGGGAL